MDGRDVFVLDASITMRWFFEPGSHSHADAILGQLAVSASEAVVPTIWRYEVSEVIARAQKQGIIPARIVADFFEDLDALPIEVDQSSDARIFHQVHQLVTTHRLTTYDAAYLDLAQSRQLPMATLDAQLIAACTSIGVPLF